MTKAKPKAKTKKPGGARRRGAQPGNKNALRHGFYSRQFKAEEIKRLDEQDPTDVKAEIELLRVVLDRLTDQLDFEPVYQPGKDEHGAPIQTQIRDDHYLKQLNTMTLIAQSIATFCSAWVSPRLSREPTGRCGLHCTKRTICQANRVHTAPAGRCRGVLRSTPVVSTPPRTNRRFPWCLDPIENKL
jgi:hypothetical protein